jgi:hypothetical protein
MSARRRGRRELAGDEIVVPELDAPRNCGGDPRGDLENGLVEAMTASHEVLHVRDDAVAGQIEVLQNAVRVQGKCEDRAPSAPMSV